METITSTTNNLVKETVKLQQKKYRTELFLLEGVKAVEEAIKSGIKIKNLFIDSSNDKLLEKFKNEKNIILTNNAVLKKISTTDSAPEIVAVAEQKKYSIELNSASKILLLENIKDAGNLGTIVRTAVAMDFDLIILYKETTDIYNPKCVRAAVGNLWKIPIVHISNFKELENKFSNFERIATLPKHNDTIFLKEFSTKKPLLLMFGSEAEGLREELISFATKKITIEMNKNVESLNLSISAGIAMYFLSRISTPNEWCFSYPKIYNLNINFKK